MTQKMEMEGAETAVPRFLNLVLDLGWRDHLTADTAVIAAAVTAPCLSGCDIGKATFVDVGSRKRAEFVLKCCERHTKTLVAMQEVFA